MAKSKYETHVLPKWDQIKEWAQNGLTDKQIYNNLKIGKNAFYQYLNFHEDFKDMLICARDNAELEVENSLYKMCLGYPFWEETSVKVKEKKYSDEGKILSEKENIEVVSLQKYSPPNFSAIQFYLTNRSKKKWASNPHANELKQKELDIRKEQNDMREW